MPAEIISRFRDYSIVLQTADNHVQSILNILVSGERAEADSFSMVTHCLLFDPFFSGNMFRLLLLVYACVVYITVFLLRLSTLFWVYTSGIGSRIVVFLS